mmetsp:Transcript_16273/g.38606  ORF Transcript_16273/g.38606 Transcript_16273/m.38606 type:complete len:345 (+) Transcript_16273:1-1035(+)
MVNSVDVFKRISQFGRTKPVNVGYVRSMLTQTLTALRGAKESIGFHHRDLHSSNVMEHIPPSSKLRAGVEGGALSMHRVKLSNNGWKYRTDACEDVWRDVEAGTSHDLGIEFKIIDFGWAVAEAVDPKEIMALMREGPTAAIGCGRCYCCLWQPKRGSAASGANAAPGAAAGDAGPERHPPPTEARAPKMSCSSVLYHHVWKGSSDCWRLLSSLAAILDDRTWHERDRADVLELQDLLLKSSGVSIRVRFTERDDSNKHKAKAYGLRWRARQAIRTLRGWVNMGWAMAFASDPGYTIDEALRHPFVRPAREAAARASVPGGAGGADALGRGSAFVDIELASPTA